ncbi:MAG: MarR family transcriptional regulator [Rhodospirillaceae bacterium]|nr:MarR family transcriptional regulator [Rhodospirillaceae bacterium]
MSTTDTHLQFLFLLSEVAWLQRREFHALTKRLKMTQVQAKALANIARREGLTQTALAQRLEVQPMTVVRLIDRMQKAGFVKRVKDPADRRAIRLYLAPKAKPILEQLWAVATVVRDQGLAGISAAEEQKLVELLRKVRANYTTETTADASPAPKSLKRA